MLDTSGSRMKVPIENIFLTTIPNSDDHVAFFNDDQYIKNKKNKYFVTRG